MKINLNIININRFNYLCPRPPQNPHSILPSLLSIFKKGGIFYLASFKRYFKSNKMESSCVLDK
jgi:hypothetical protein